MFVKHTEEYLLRIKRATVISLVLIILLFWSFPVIEIKKEENSEIVFTSLNVENIPITRQGTRRKPPPKPAVPIPADDELIPEDLTIEETELDLEQYSQQIGMGLIASAPVVYQPRPIFEVIPEYPQELQKKGIEGIIKLHIHINKYGLVDEVVVLENTTGSRRCALSAKKAALKSRYLPAKKSKKPTDIWITRIYTFGIQK